MSDKLDTAKLLTTYALLGHLWNEQHAKPKHTELRLVKDGWEVWGGEVEKPLPCPVDFAYELSGYDQRVLDKTRVLCGELRVRAKRSAAAREQLADLRAGLEKARAIKAQRVVEQHPLNNAIEREQAA